MRINFSRHAKRRADLYNISESIILKVLENKDLSHQGMSEIVENVEGVKYPLKIVVAVVNDITTIVTNYPLKKGRKV